MILKHVVSSPENEPVTVCGKCGTSVQFQVPSSNIFKE